MQNTPAFQKHTDKQTNKKYALFFIPFDKKAHTYYLNLF